MNTSQLDILVDDGHARGVVAMNMMEGTMVQINATLSLLQPEVVAVRSASILTAVSKTGDGLSMAYRHGVPLRDMNSFNITLPDYRIPVF